MARESLISAELHEFLTKHAAALDEHDGVADSVVPALGSAGILRHGLPSTTGGHGTPLSRAIESVAAVAEQSLASAFVMWGQRAFIEYVARGESHTLKEQLLPALLQGDTSGATGLSNAMKFLSGLEGLGIEARPESELGGTGWILQGTVPWVTNVPARGFRVAVAVRRPNHPAMVVAVSSTCAGVARSADLDLLGLRGTRTAALKLDSVVIRDDDVLAHEAPRWLPAVRPIFLGLQCGLSIGLARASLAAARQQAGGAIVVLGAPLDDVEQQLEALVLELAHGVDKGRFVAEAARLFEIRIQLAEIALQAVTLELQASGGRAYHRNEGLGFARRWREAAFIPVVTPSLAQLKGELVRHQQRTQAA